MPAPMPTEERVAAAMKGANVQVAKAPAVRAQIGVAHAAQSPSVSAPAPNIPGQNVNTTSNNITGQAVSQVASLPQNPSVPATNPSTRGPSPIPQIRPDQFSSPFAQNPYSTATTTNYANPEGSNDALPPPNIPTYRNRNSLEQKENELKRQEQELLTLQQQMQSRLDELKKVESNVQGMLNEATTEQDDKIKHLVAVYANMKPKRAAQVLATLDEKISVKILAGLKADQAGDILTYMETEPAARLSELLSKSLMR